MTVEKFGDPLLFATRMLRIAGRAQRATELYRWGLNPQKADERSSLALDDAGFLSSLGGGAVERAALWPVMSATDNVSTAGNVFSSVPASRQLRASSLMSLCRSALESSSRTVWLLSDPDRAVRRKRCIGIALAEMKQQTMYNGLEVGYLRGGQVSCDPEHAREFQEGHKKLLSEFGTLKEIDHEAVRPFGKTVELAAQWIDDHLPEHDSGELSDSSMVVGVKRVYSLSSGVIHGYQWITDYTYNGDLFAMLADSFAAAVNMTECAIALLEAQSQDPSGSSTRERHYPDRLAPTIAAWSRLYQ